MWKYNQTPEPDDIMHYGILGMKWGVRRSKTGYRSTNIKAARARRANDKVDAGFKDWQENAKKRDNAISLGKKATTAKLAYENNRSDNNLKSAYKSANNEYKKALKENTTYRKGVVRKEVGQDASRKYLSEAKKVKKQLDLDPSNKQLKKSYTDLMNKYDVERANARRATEVSLKRSNKKASIKRSMTIGVKAAAGTAAVAGGLYAVNKYLDSHDVTLNGQPVRIGKSMTDAAANVIKKGKDILGYMY